MNYLIFFGGVLVGACAGMLAMALCYAAGKGWEDDGPWNR